MAKDVEKQIEIYKGAKGEVIFDVDVEAETIWATQAQIAELFGVVPQNITYHLKKIYETKELEEKRTCKKNLQVQNEGGREIQREVKMYNLDAIISVGYRVNSRKATDFRIWATKTLKQYLVTGVAVNARRLKNLDQKKLKDVEGMMGVVRRLMAHNALSAGEANGVLEVISKYAGSWETLEQFDDGHISFGQGRKARKSLSPGDCRNFIEELRDSLDASELFGKERDESFKGILVGLDQSFDGRELYGSVSEKAANLLYLVIKDHPFYDGNKRIASLLFIVFLTVNDFQLTKTGETKISDRALTAIALLIAESEPSEKGLIVALICKLLEG